MCRATDEGGRRCRGGHGPARNAKDRARRALRKVGGSVLTAEPLWVPVTADETGYGADVDEYDIDGELIITKAMAVPEVAPGVSSYVGSVAEIHGLLRGNGPGAFGSLTMVGAWKRDSDGQLNEHQHADLGRLQHVTGSKKSRYDIGDGAGEFVLGRPEPWSFNDGLGTFTSAGVAFQYRFSGPTPAPRAPSVSPARAREQIAQAVGAVVVAVEEAMASLDGADPAAALESYQEANAHLTERRRVLDAGACNVLGVTSPEWNMKRDRENPELLEAEAMFNQVYGSSFNMGLAYAEKRLVEYESTRRNTAGIQDHIDDLRAARRGALAASRLLNERRSRAQEVGV